MDCITYGYDAAGRIKSVDYADPATTDITGISYDELGRRIDAEEGPVTEEWAWDDLSRLTSHVDVNGRTTGYGWDSTSNLISITYPGKSTPLVRRFDAAGRMDRVTDWSGRVTNFGFDDDSNWTTTTFPSASTNSDVRTFDAAGRFTGVTWKRGATVLGSLTYAPRDAKGLVTAVTAAGAGVENDSWDYDGRDRLTDTASAGVGFGPATDRVAHSASM